MRSSLVLLSLLGLTLSIQADDAAMSANVQPVAAKKSLASRLKSKLGLNVGKDIQTPKEMYQYLSNDLVQAVETGKKEDALRLYNEELIAAPATEQDGLKNEFAQAWAKRIQLKQAKGAALAQKGKADMTASAVATGAGVITTAAGGAVVAEGAARKGIAKYKAKQVDKTKAKPMMETDSPEHAMLLESNKVKAIADAEQGARNAAANTKYRTGTMIGGGAVAAAGVLTTAGGAAGIAHAASELKAADAILREAREEIAIAENLGLFGGATTKAVIADTKVAEELLDDAKQSVAADLEQMAPAVQAPAQTTVTVSTPTKTTVVSTKTAPKGRAPARSTARASAKGKATRTQAR
jgi:hypothetical protein